MKDTFLAIDFGGGSGRVMAGSLTNHRLHIEEVYRFPNRQIKLGKHLYWDFLSLFQEMKNGIAKAVHKGYHIRTIGIDTWGVDFGLIDKQGNLLGNPVCYRDDRTAGMPERFFKQTKPACHYAETGIQVMPINTLFQLLSMKEANDPTLQAADRLLFMPDLFNYFLTGIAANEYSIASTSELLNATQRTWSGKVLKEAALPCHLFGPIIHPGSIHGEIKDELADELELPHNVQVVAVGSHDTASAVFAVPGSNRNSAFLSSGTWSLLGTMLDEPILTEDARKAGFSNEGGVLNKICFLQNITGLWMVQRLMAEWEACGKSSDYERINKEAENSAIRSFIHVDDACFQNPVNMEQTIREQCIKNNQAVPSTQGDFMRCICESLARRYKQGMEELNNLLPDPVQQLHIIGGGCKNKLLNQLTANALGIPVYAGPAEATAIGNILLQAYAIGSVCEHEMEAILTESTQPQMYQPQ